MQILSLLFPTTSNPRFAPTCLYKQLAREGFPLECSMALYIYYESLVQ